MVILFLTFQYFQQNVAACITIMSGKQNLTIGLNFFIMIGKDLERIFLYIHKMDFAGGFHFATPALATDFTQT